MIKENFCSLSLSSLSSSLNVGEEREVSLGSEFPPSFAGDEDE